RLGTASRPSLSGSCPRRAERPAHRGIAGESRRAPHAVIPSHPDHQAVGGWRRGPHAAPAGEAPRALPRSEDRLADLARERRPRAAPSRTVERGAIPAPRAGPVRPAMVGDPGAVPPAISPEAGAL